MIIEIYQQTKGNDKGLWFADLYEGDKLKVKCYMSGFESKQELLQSISRKGSVKIYQKSKSFFA